MMPPRRLNRSERWPLSTNEDSLLARPLNENDRVDDFDSGVHALDFFLRRHALNNAKDHLGQTYIIDRNPDDPSTWPQILGFFTLSTSQVSRDLVAPILGEQLPKYPIPAVLLARLAVDVRVQGKKLGSILLRDAFRLAQLIAAHVGCAGVLVDAKDDGARAFYLHAGFVGLRVKADGWPQRLFYPMKTIELLLGRLGEELTPG